MNATTRTAIYAGAAVVLAGAAWLTNRAMQPPDLSGFNLVGEPFYPRFEDPTKAARLRVAAYDALNEEPEVFTVEKHGQQWRIPSHYDYPAEAKEQLAKTAASVIGIERQALASRRKADHERLGVVDPLSDEEGVSGRSRGQRITLYDEAGNELVDFIIGKRVDESEQASADQTQYYVRRADEMQVYRTALSINLSTKFSEWIEPDLLKLSTSDVIRLDVRLPVFEEKEVQTPLGVAVTEQFVGEDRFRLARDDGFAEWKLQSLDEETEELDDGPVRDAVNALDDLEIVGVRPKPPGLLPDLSFDPKYVSDPQQWQQLREQLRSKGYALVEDPETRERQLFSRQGELTAATEQGVVYHLHFGNRVSGAEEEIEVGGASGTSGSATAAENAGDDEATSSGQDDTEADGSDESGEASDGDEKPGRYVFVRVEFDADLIGKPPAAPEKPEKPPELKEADQQKADDGEGGQSQASDAGSERQEPADTNQEEGAAATASDANEDDSDDGEKDDNQPEKDPLKEIRDEYEQALQDYEQAKEQYQQDKKEYEENVEEGKKKVDFLNNRFKNWYYVISADNYDALRLTRDKLVKPKQSDEDDGGSETSNTGRGAPSSVEAPVPSKAE